MQQQQNWNKQNEIETEIEMKNVVENVCAQFLWMRNLLYIFGQPFFWRDAWQWNPMDIAWLCIQRGIVGAEADEASQGAKLWKCQNGAGLRRNWICWLSAPLEMPEKWHFNAKNLQLTA